MSNITIYVMTNWQNLPTKTTPVDATNLNHIEQGIKSVTDFINTLNADSGKYLCQVAFTTALKNKLDGIEDNANNYTLPTASTSTKGGVKVDGVTITINQAGVISAAAAAIPNLVNLTDVQVSQLADGHILKWDDTESKWVNAPESGGTTIEKLNDVGDVDITDPSDGDGLVWDAQNEVWTNGSVASAVSQLTDVNLNRLADGQSLVWDATSSKWINQQVAVELSYQETLEVLGDPGEELDPIYQPSIYSTSEQLSGKWVDGRPLYQKTFVIEYSTPATLSAGSEVTLDADFADLSLYDNLFKETVSVYANNGVDNYMGDGYCTIQQTSYQSKGLYALAVIALSNVTKILATVKYTKSTDPVPNS